jgi:hypothetical protein
MVVVVRRGNTPIISTEENQDIRFIGRIRTSDEAGVLTTTPRG